MQIKINAGRYRGKDITDQTFPLLKPVADTPKGKVATVDASSLLGADYSKVRVIVEDWEATGVEETATIEPETDDEVMDRIESRFKILDQMTEATLRGDVRALIVVGPPGVGKSYGIEKELEKYNLFNAIGGKPPIYEVVKGAMTALGLYCKLFEFSAENSVLVFDDCDSVFTDELSLNILKAALDSKKKRTIHWNADSHKLRNEGVPNKFEFSGAVIFVTNIKFDNVRSPKMRDHLDALMSRCHYLDLTLDTMRDKFLRIRQIARSGQLFPEYGMDSEGEAEIIEFMKETQNQLREVSLRMAIKLADLKRMDPTNWQIVAQNTCMKQR